MRSTCKRLTAAAVVLATAVLLLVVPLHAAAGYAIRFHGGGNSSNVDKAYLPLGEPSNALNVGQSDFTIEFWVLASTSNTSTGVTAGANYSWIDGNIILDRDLLGSVGSGGDWGVSLDDGRVAFGIENSGGSQRTIIGTSDIRSASTWAHVAVTRQRSSGDMAVYVNGSREAFQAGGPSGDVHYDDARTPTTYDPFLGIGGEKHALDWPQGQAILQFDELRVSNSLRYTGTTYTVPTDAFVTDANTVGLYHFDSSSGTTVIDSSGNGIDGSFTVGGSGPGPTWLLSTAPLAGDGAWFPFMRLRL